MATPPWGGLIGTLPTPVGLGGSLASGGGVPTAIHFWPMTEGSGSTFVDHIGTVNLSVTNAGWVSTPSGMGSSSSIASFSGTVGLASAYQSSLDFNGSQPMSVAVWLYSSGTGSATLCGNLDTASVYQGWELTNSGPSTGIGLLEVNTVTTNQMTAVAPTINPVSTASLVVFTYSGSLNVSGVKGYLNGTSQSVEDTSGTLSSTFTSPTVFAVGARSNNTNNYTGSMAYLRVWNQVLTPTQVSALYAAGPQ